MFFNNIDNTDAQTAPASNTSDRSNATNSMMSDDSKSLSVSSHFSVAAEEGHMVDDECVLDADAEANMDCEGTKKIMTLPSTKKVTTLRARLNTYKMIPAIAVLLFLILVVLLVATPRNGKTSNTSTSISSAKDGDISTAANDPSYFAGSGVGVNINFSNVTQINLNNITTSIPSSPPSPQPTPSPTSSPSIILSRAPTELRSSPPTVKTTTSPTPSPSEGPPVPAWHLTKEINMTDTGLGNDNFNGDIDNSFGHSVAISASGRHVAVGAPGYMNGHVQIYRQSSAGKWTRYGDPIEEMDKFYLFGASVLLSADGTKLAVRSLHSGTFAKGVYAIVYIYNNDAGRWIPDPSLTYLKMPVSKNPDISESAMAFSGEGKTLALASTILDSNYTGHEEDTAYVTLYHDFQYFTILLNSTIHHDDHYLSLSYDGSRIAYSDSERVYVKEYSQKNVVVQFWKLVGLVIESDDPSDKDFGSSVVLSPDGNYLAITSRSNTKVYVSPPHDIDDQASTDTTPWRQVGDTIYNADTTKPTSYVSLWSHELTKGDGSGTVDLLTLTLSDSGSVRVLQYETGKSTTWALKGGKTAMLHAGEWPTGFGTSLSVSEDGETVVVGAPVLEEDVDDFKDGGKVLIYDLNLPSS